MERTNKMRVIATERAFHDKHFIEEGEVFHAHKKGFDENNLPHYLKPYNAPEKRVVVEEVPDDELEEDSDDFEITAETKVCELPEEVKQSLLNKAKELGITGNLTSYKVSSLKKKIAAKSVGGESYPGEELDTIAIDKEEDEGSAE